MTAPTYAQMAEACERQADWMMGQPGALTMVDEAVRLRAAAAVLQELAGGQRMETAGYDATCAGCFTPYTFYNAKVVGARDWEHFCSRICENRPSSTRPARAGRAP